MRSNVFGSLRTACICKDHPELWKDQSGSYLIKDVCGWPAVMGHDLGMNHRSQIRLQMPKQGDCTILCCN